MRVAVSRSVEGEARLPVPPVIGDWCPPRTTPAVRPPLGALLLAKGAIRASDLVRALEIQNRQTLRLGDILRAHGMASDEIGRASCRERV